MLFLTAFATKLCISQLPSPLLLVTDSPCTAATDRLPFIIRCYALKVPCISGNDLIDFISNLLDGRKEREERERRLKNCIHLCMKKCSWTLTDKLFFVLYFCPEALLSLCTIFWHKFSFPSNDFLSTFTKYDFGLSFLLQFRFGNNIHEIRFLNMPCVKYYWFNSILFRYYFSCCRRTWKDTELDAFGKWFISNSPLWEWQCM